MFLYSLRLALLNLTHRPGLTLLTICAISIGLALLTTMTTMSYQASKVPLQEKSDQMHTVFTDNRSTEADEVTMIFRQPYLTYQDTLNIYNDQSVDVEKTYLWKSFAFLNDTEGKAHPRQARTMAGISNFFTMFDVPFLYGSGWTQQDDENGSPVIVLSYEMNQHFFGGENSVGKTIRINSTDLTVIGVLAHWKLVARFYDRSFSGSRFDDAFLPSSLALNINLRRLIVCENVDSDVQQAYRYEDVAGLKASECTWLVLWAYLKDRSTKQAFETYIKNYINDQKSFGRYPRQEKPFLLNIMQFVEQLDSLNTTQTTFNVLALLFFLVCLLNTVGILLAKYMGKVPEIALRRALGAKKHVILMQYLLEVGIIAFIGGLIGLLLSYFGLIGMKQVFIYQSDYSVTAEAIEHLYRLDWIMMAQAMTIAIGSSLVISLFPVWKICNTAPAGQLKAQ